MLPLFENVVQVVVSLDLSNGAHAVEEIDKSNACMSKQEDGRFRLDWKAM